MLFPPLRAVLNIILTSLFTLQLKIALRVLSPNRLWLHFNFIHVWSDPGSDFDNFWSQARTRHRWVETSRCCSILSEIAKFSWFLGKSKSSTKPKLPIGAGFVFHKSIHDYQDGKSKPLPISPRQGMSLDTPQYPLSWFGLVDFKTLPDFQKTLCGEQLQWWMINSQCS